MKVDSVWKKTLSLLENKMNRPAYEIFMKRILPVSITDDTLYLKIPGTLSMDYLDEYREIIEDASSQAFGSRITIIASQSEPPAAAPVQTAPRFPAAQKTPQRKTVPMLNKKYTFDNFVVGASNRLCHAASLAVAEAPGKTYNPLFIYGGVGLGKTHVMQAIGHYIINTKPNLNLDYVTTDAFVHEMMRYIQDGRLFHFRNRFQRSDLLLIDDIQFLQGKDRTQYEFFQIFNSFYEAKKQIVVTCDRLPKEIPTLEDRLVSRLNWGLIADIKPPDFETRLAILRNKVDNDSTPLPDDVLELIASTVQSNIRDLEGTLNRIIAYASLSDKDVTLSLAEEIIKDILPTKDPSAISIHTIIKEVSKYYGVDADDLTGKRRKREIVLPRMVAMYLARELTGFSLSHIGKEFGNKDHSSVLYSFEKIEKGLLTDPTIKLAVENIRSQLTR